MFLHAIVLLHLRDVSGCLSLACPCFWCFDVKGSALFLWSYLFGFQFDIARCAALLCFVRGRLGSLGAIFGRHFKQFNFRAIF